MRVVVVGSGVVGLLTAIECVRAGARVDVVDRADIPSPWATSNDRHRVVRALHRGDASLTRAAAHADESWLTVERRLGTRFYHRVGALTAMPAEEVPTNLTLLAGAGVPARTLTAEELSARYPRIRFPAAMPAVFERAAGAVLADRSLAAMARWLRGQPAVHLYPHRRVVTVDGPGVQLADGAFLVGDRVVVAAGPWSRELLPAALGAELTLYRQSMLSYAATPSREAWAGTPVILGLGPTHGAWLMPPVADTPVRLSAASACRAVTEMTDRVTPTRWRDLLVDQFSALLVGFDPAAVADVPDGYYLADTASGGPVLATIGDGTVLAYAACGGMSFKFAPLIARALADRALGRSPRRTGLPIDRPRQFAAGEVRLPAAAGPRDADRPDPRGMTL